MTRRYPHISRADCGFCVLDGPDEDGQYDLNVNPSCPYHASSPKAATGHPSRKLAPVPPPAGAGSGSTTSKKAA